MLKSTLSISGKSRKFSCKQTRQQVNFLKELTLSIRSVTTTSTTSKINSLAQEKQQQQQQRIDKDDHQLSSSNSSSNAQQEQSLEIKYQARLANLSLWHSVDTIKRLGHRVAKLDPLNLSNGEQGRNNKSNSSDFTWSDSLIKEMRAKRDIVATCGFLDTNQPLMATNELLEAVLSIYTGSECALEFEHLSSQQEVEWLTSHWERLSELFHLGQVKSENIAKLLLECEAFDHFMGAKFPSCKRYSCEGAEPMLVVFDEILRLCHLGELEMDEMTRPLGQIDDVIIGMPHRGRLNLLTCLLGMGPRVIFNKCCGQPEFDLREAWMAKGDVLSHLSLNTRFVYGLDRQHIGLSRDTPNPINVSLLPNPSHLEISSPMVIGVARGRAHNKLHGYPSSPKFPPQPAASDSSLSSSYCSQFSKQILPIQVHGDAALAGQGIIQETQQLANLPTFSVGGSIHLIVNNQIGFTTPQTSGRSSRYCTDILKLNETPIIHVNGQNIPGVIRATRLALAYRQRFGKDIAIDLVCYRQHGHNELDEPAFTQPLMYSAIRSRKSIPQTYCDQIGLEPESRKRIIDGFRQKLQAAYKQVDVFKPDNDNYRNFALPSEYQRDHVCSWQSGCDLELLQSVALASVDTPSDFSLHPTLDRALVADRRLKFTNKNAATDLPEVRVDWASGEILAFGSLLAQNNSVRLSGQDVERGTFSTRHAVFYDQKTGKPWIPLNNMRPPLSSSSSSAVHSDGASEVKKQQRAQLEIVNSVLSEEAVLAYEFGYSMETCALTIWEAQYGDFANTAQSVIDTLVSSSESKWLRQSPLTLLLPHGLDGTGPEHSSSRLERFLQLSSSSSSSIDTDAKVNWSVCFPTKPSQYFHLLRRQVLRPFRKPLVVMSPKVIFRHPECVSKLADFGPDSSFEPVLDDPSASERVDRIDTLILCSGKVYYMLEDERKSLNLDNVAILRIEELCPFPIQALVQTMKQYRNVKPNQLVWFQEEHKNQGAYGFVSTRLDNIAGIKLRYIGREESELPATGIAQLHQKELESMKRELESLAKRSSS